MLESSTQVIQHLLTEGLVLHSGAGGSLHGVLQSVAKGTDDSQQPDPAALPRMGPIDELDSDTDMHAVSDANGASAARDVKGVDYQLGSPDRID